MKNIFRGIKRNHIKVSFFIFSKSIYQLSFLLFLYGTKKVLSDELFGIFTIIILIGNYYNFLSIGFIPWFSQIAPSLENMKVLESLKDNLRFVQFLLIYVLTSILAVLFIELFPSYQYFIIFCYVVLVNRTSVNFFLNYFRTLRMDLELNLVHLLNSVTLFVISGYILLFNGLDLYRIILISSVPLLFHFVLFFPIRLSKTNVFKLRRIRSYLSFAWMNLSRQITERIDQITISGILPIEIVGTYNLASTIASGLFMPIQSIQAFMYPLVVKAIKQSKKVNVESNLVNIYSKPFLGIFSFIVFITTIFIVVLSVGPIVERELIQITFYFFIIKLISVPRLNLKSIGITLGYTQAINISSSILLLFSLFVWGILLFLSKNIEQGEGFVYAIKFISELYMFLSLAYIIFKNNHHALVSDIRKKSLWLVILIFINLALLLTL